MTDQIDIIVVGAGHNGLVCAATLAQTGRRVLLLEAGERVGGMAAPDTFGEGFGTPGLAQLAHPVNPIIRKNLKLDQLGYQPGNPVDTIALDVEGRHRFLSASGASGEGLSEDDQTAWHGFRQQALDFAKACGPLFENRPPRLKNMPFKDKVTLGKLAWRLRFGLGKVSMYEFLRVAGINIYDLLNETFDDELLKGALAFDAVLGSAMGPRSPGTLLTWLQRLRGELHGPLSMVAGNGVSLVTALEQAAVNAGVTLRTNTRVEEILVDKGSTLGVRLTHGETIDCRQVVSALDPRATFSDLVGDRALDAMFANRVGQIRGMGVVAQLHLGLAELPSFNGLTTEQLAHRLLVTGDQRSVERAFNHCKYGEYSERPALEITLPSLHDPALAPNGTQVMSVNVAWVPYELEAGWAGERDILTRRVIEQLELYAPGLAEQVVAQQLITPRDIEKTTAAVQGHWHHGELTLHQSFMMRPLHGAAQYDTPISGLYLCSAGCHPGGGLNGMPGHLAAQRVIEQEAAQ